MAPLSTAESTPPPDSPHPVDRPDHRQAAEAVTAAAERLGQLAASLGSESTDALPPTVSAWLITATEQLEQLLASRPSATGVHSPAS